MHYRRMSLAIIIVIALGVPFGAGVILYRQKQMQPEVPGSLKRHVAENLDITIEEAAIVVNDVRLGSSFGFLVDAFKPTYYFWESMDMLRKLALVGMVLIFERGTVHQISLSLMLS